MNTLPLLVLIAGVLVGLYPLVKTAALDLIHEHKIGTELFVTLATTLALIGRAPRSSVRGSDRDSHLP